MALSRTWYTDANITASDTSTALLSAKSVLWGLKALLKGEIGTNTHGLWTVVSSSDSVSTSATDLWTSAFDATKLVRAAPASNHSWILLQSPAGLGPIYMCLDFAGTSDVNCVNAAFSNVAFTGGTISARPTSTSEWIHIINANWVENVTVPLKIHRTTDADGNFFFLASKTGSGVFFNLFGVQTLTLTKSLDTNKVVSFHHYLAGAKGAGTAGGTGLFTVTEAVAGGLCGRNFNGLAQATAIAAMEPYVGGQPVATTWTTTNAADGLVDAFPVYVGNSAAGYMGIRGLLPDVSVLAGGTTAGQGLAPGALIPSTGTPERVLVGSIAIPFNVAPVL
jgi:hypothetical protein